MANAKWRFLFAITQTEFAFMRVFFVLFCFNCERCLNNFKVSATIGNLVSGLTRNLAALTWHVELEEGYLLSAI